MLSISNSCVIFFSVLLFPAPLPSFLIFSVFLDPHHSLFLWTLKRGNADDTNFEQKQTRLLPVKWKCASLQTVELSRVCFFV